LLALYTSDDSKKLSATELSGDWTKKEKREQTPALQMELSIELIIAWFAGKSIGKERAGWED
jgi:hypothetical protein